MSQLEAIERGLPWGFHDAFLTRLDIDWVQATATMALRAAITKRQDEDRLGQLTFGGLIYCSLDAPQLDESRGYTGRGHHGLMVDCGEGFANDDARRALP